MRLATRLGLAALLGLFIAISEPRAESGDPSAYLAVRALGAIATVDDVAVRGIPGAARLEHDYDQNAGFAIAFGLRQPGVLRAELEYAFRYRYDVDVRVAEGGVDVVDVESNLQSHSLMVNVFYDWRWGRSLEPYVGVGLGWVRHISDARLENLTGPAPILKDTATRDNLVWSLALGIAWRVAENWDVTLGYRFVGLGEVDVGNFGGGQRVEAETYYSHDVLLGLAYRF